MKTKISLSLDDLKVDKAGFEHIVSVPNVNSVVIDELIDTVAFAYGKLVRIQ